MLMNRIAAILFAVVMVPAQEPIPVDPLPKPVFSIRPEILNRNGFVRPYRNLTSFYFHNRTGGSYDRRYVDPEVFHRNYLETSRVWERDRDVTLPLFTTLDLESLPIGAVNNQKWLEWTAQYRRICQMMAASGRDVAVYGLLGSSAEFQMNWNTYYQLYERKDFRRAQKFLAMRGPVEENLAKVAARFDDVIDISMSSCYAPYPIPSVESWQMSAFLYHVERRCRLARQFHPSKPHYVWLQPNFTADGFSEMPEPVWRRIVEYCYLSPDIDGIMVFTLETYGGNPVSRAEGWENVFLGDGHGGGPEEIAEESGHPAHEIQPSDWR